MTIKSQLCISSSLQGTRQMTGRKYFNFWDIRSEANSSLHKAAQLDLGKYLFFQMLFLALNLYMKQKGI